MKFITQLHVTLREHSSATEESRTLEVETLRYALGDISLISILKILRHQI